MAWFLWCISLKISNQITKVGIASLILCQLNFTIHPDIFDFHWPFVLCVCVYFYFSTWHVVAAYSACVMLDKFVNSWMSFVSRWIFCKLHSSREWSTSGPCDFRWLPYYRQSLPCTGWKSWCWSRQSYCFGWRTI